MITRNDYISGKASHQDCYSQFVTQCGDYPTLADKVCILKEAARQIATQ